MHPLTKGIKSDDSRSKFCIDQKIGDEKLEDLVPFDLDRLRVNLLKEKSPQTVKHVMGLIKRFSNFAMGKRLCKGLNFKVVMNERG